MFIKIAPQESGTYRLKKGRERKKRRGDCNITGLRHNCLLLMLQINVNVTINVTEVGNKLSDGCYCTQQSEK